MPTSRTAAGSYGPAQSVPDPHEPLAAVSGHVNALLDTHLARWRRLLGQLDAALQPVADELGALVTAGGKRLRPAFVYWGYRATGAVHDDGLWHPAAAVELLHTFALVHDDVMDRSEQRRGRPSVHRALADHHRRAGLHGDPDWFGVGAAVLAGDLLFVWADELLDAAPLPAPALGRARRVFAQLRTEVMAGQYLDLRLAGLPDGGEAEALQVALLKSGRYTVTRPLQLGAALAGEDEALRAVLGDYGDAVGLAFQLRDDVLGLFGDPSDTGKSALADLREGKRTILVQRALERADSAGRAILQQALGSPDVDEGAAERVREVVLGTGALDDVERLLREKAAEARHACASIPEPGRNALERLADLAVQRSR